MSELLSQSERSLIFKELGEQDNSPLLWKVCGHGTNNLNQLLNEFEVLGNLSVSSIRKPIKRGIYQNREAFAYRFVDGISLREFIDHNPVSPTATLEISLGLVRTLRQIHQSGICHFRLNSHNLLYNSRTRKTHIIDFTLSGEPGARKISEFETWGNELSYMAPEMTGRLDQELDERSDLYSLGIIMFEMLSGKLPFKNESRAELIHDILIKIPPSLHSLNSEIPVAVSEMVEKLLAKDPRDRYQTTHGLEHDLERLSEAIANPEWDGKMTLAKEDSAQEFYLSERLYGRGQELDQINHLLGSLSKSGNKILLVSSKPGGGKTALVDSFKKTAAQQGGLVLSGKFERPDQNIPHQAMVQALRELAAYILSRPDSQLAQWKSVIQRAVGDIGHVLAEMVPDFEWILPSSEVGSELSASQLMSRINFLFQRIIEEVASPTQPLILFFDDLQWADPASLNSLQSIISNQYADHFLLIAAYRKEESEGSGQIPAHVDTILATRPDTLQMELEGLSTKDIKQFIKESIAVEKSSELSELTYAKTLGNPFFVRKFLERLYDHDILRYSLKHKVWVWDEEKAQAVQISDNVIEYMTVKIKKLAKDERHLLSLAAFIGSHFTSVQLQLLSEWDAEKIKSALDLFKIENLIESSETGYYHFVHDRIQHTALQMIDEGLVGRFHHIMAQALDKTEAEKPGSVNIFELAHHYNEGKSHLHPENHQHYLDINLRAGIEAKRTASFELAFDYFQQALQTVEPSDWEHHYPIILRLHHEAAEAGMIIGKRQEADHWLQIALEKAIDGGDRLRAHEIKLNHLTETHQFPEAVSHLLQVLDEIGYGIQRHPGKLTILKEFLQVQWHLRGKKIENIPQLAPMAEERAKAFLKLTVMATTSLFGHAPDILPIVFFRQVKLSLKYGNSIYSPNSYVSYGFAITVFMGNLDKGYQFGKMGLSLMEKLNAEVVKAKVMVIFYGFLAYWKDSLIGSLAPLKQAYITGRQTGDLLYASFALSFQSSIRLQAGNPLSEVFASMTEDCMVIKNLGQDLVYNITETQRQYVKKLVQVSNDPLRLGDENFETEILNKLDQEDDTASKFDLYYYKMALGFLFNNYDAAYENILLGGKYEDETTARQIPYPSFILLSSLVAIKKMSLSDDRAEIKKLRKQVTKKLRLLKSFTKHAPQNFSNKLWLVKAMIHEADEDMEEALSNFLRAIGDARTAGFIHEEALAREHFAYFLMGNGNQEYGEAMLQRAFTCYQQWGCVSKCVQLKNRFSEVINSPVLKVEKGMATYQNIYDLNTIIRTNQALSSENSLKGLLGTMTDMMIQNASVSKVVIALKNEGEEVSSIAYSDQKEQKVVTNDFQSLKDLYPTAIVNVVTRSREAFISPNLGKDHRYIFDPYIQSELPQSVCCLPIITKEEILGTIYLENNLAENAFDPGRVEFFKTITAQMAISLDNVMLYSEMEQKVNDRTMALMEKNDELARQKKKSDDLLLNILPAETAEELKNFGKTTARSYDTVTVLFADIRNFSKIAESLSPDELVSELDFCFKTFDDISAAYELEKIKTIGDAYMAAGGIPDNNKATPEGVIKAALAMRDFTRDLSAKRKMEGRTFFEVRIGIHTGPVVAGVVGHKKFQFDIWGNTVNLAARMEQNSEAGKVNVSQATYELIKEHFTTVHRGKVSVKNMGEVDMYFVEDLPTTP